LSGSEPQQRRSDPKRVSSVSTPILNHKSDSGETAKFQADPQPKGNLPQRLAAKMRTAAHPGLSTGQFVIDAGERL
jgi:hypothetical protein